MIPARRRFFILLAIPLVAVLLASGVYMLGMDVLEDRPRDFWASLSWAAETITTTGYGADTSWRHPAMVLFVVLVQFFGVVLIYMVIPFYLIPYIDERFESRLPTQAPKLEGHVVVYRYGAAVESLLGELQNAGVPTLVVECEQERARQLVGRRINVVYGPTPDEALASARLGRARSLIANGSDEENASITLLARHLDFRGDVVALVEDPNLRRPMNLAGADAVYTPRHLLATALAARASHRLAPRISNVQNLGRHLEVSELRVEPDSPLAGKTLAEARLGEEIGVTVLGQWVSGRLQTDVTARTRIEPRGILIAIGRADGLESLAKLAGGQASHRRQGPFVVGGCGVVGGKIRQMLQDLGEDVVAIDRQGDVDVLGDILDPKILDKVDPRESRGIILALDSDSATLFATVVVRERAPNTPIVARVNEAHNVERIHRAGADFALSISQVAGQILARRLLGQESITVDPHLKVLKVEGARFAGRRAAELGLRERTGCSVVAVERGEDVTVDLGAGFLFEKDDAVYVCGSPEATRQLTQVFPVQGA